jgi:hypothetical protein
MSAVEATASSGAVLGVVVVLLLQQLGFLALSDLWTTVLVLLTAIVVGAVIFGALGARADRR